MFVHKMKYCAAIKKDEIVPFGTTWMDLESIMLNEISQTEKDKYHMISLVWNLKKKQKQKQNQTHKYRKQTDGCQRAGGWAK